MCRVISALLYLYCVPRIVTRRYLRRRYPGRQPPASELSLMCVGLSMRRSLNVQSRKCLTQKTPTDLKKENNN